MKRNKQIQCKHISEVEILKVCVIRQGTPDEVLSHKYPVAVIMKKMEKMCLRGLLDYGVSLRTAWPTDDGLALLNEERPA